MPTPGVPKGTEEARLSSAHSSSSSRAESKPWKWRCSPLATSFAVAACSVLLAYVGRETALLLIDLKPWPRPYYLLEDWRVIPVAPALAALLTSLACTSLSPGSGWPWGGRIVSGLAILSTAALVAFCTLVLTRTATRPPIDAYLDHLAHATHVIPPPGIEYQRQELQIVVTIPPWKPGDPKGPRPVLVTDYRPGPEGFRVFSIGDQWILQLCQSDGCWIEIAPSAEDLDARPENKALQPILSWISALRNAPLQRWNEALRFTVDPGGSVLFLDKPDPHREFHLVEGRWEAVEFSARRIAARTSAPSAWLWTALAGLGLVGILYAVRRRVSSRRRVLEAARPGTLGEDGRVTFEDGAIVRVDPPPSLAPGPVLVLRDLSGSTYRQNDVLSRKDIRAGSLGEHLAKLRFDLLRCEAAIVAVACLTAAPLLGAALVGLVI